MSYFYLTPSDGTASLHTLEECVFRRLNYLKSINDGQYSRFCEFLLEGSVLDNVGHFLLGMLARLSESKPLQDLVNHGELILFKNRIDTAKVSEIRLLCKSILKSSNVISAELRKSSHLNIIVLLSKKLIIKQIAEHVFDKDHSSDCNAHTIDTKYIYCLPLVAKRRVELTCGSARIPCGLWKYFFRLLFKTHLDYKFNNLKNSALSLDPRWREMIVKMIQIIPSNNITNVMNLKYINIDSDLYLFPLCMKNLHSILRTKHRLSHDERFRYSLFLKDIGLSLDEAIHFWQNEYSKPHSDKTACSHIWSKDEKKFIYGIRHLYGLEGARKNYCMSYCNKIQSRPSPEGGCAFKHYDNAYLEKLADNKIFNSNDWDKITAKIKAGRSSEACAIYKKAIVSQIINKSQSEITRVDVSSEYSPVNYYLDLKRYTETKPKHLCNS